MYNSQQYIPDKYGSETVSDLLLQHTFSLSPDDHSQAVFDISVESLESQESLFGLGFSFQIAELQYNVVKPLPVRQAPSQNGTLM